MTIGLARNTLAGRVEAIVTRDLPYGPVRATDVAAELGITYPTLRFRLQRHHTSYLKLVNQTRKERAAAMVTRSGLPMRAVARHLGFKSAEAFTRWFGRQFGEAPTAVKRRQNVSSRGACDRVTV